MNPGEMDMLYLAACALQGIQPDKERVARMNLPRVYQCSKFHNMNAIVCMTLEEDLLLPGWKEEKEKAVRKSILLNAERTQILGWMEKKGIWYLPLKGILLQELYPRIGMRQMADNDILFDAAYQKELCEYMCSRGYEVKSFGKGHHDTYIKEPVYNIEMHTRLFDEMHNSVWREYYADIRTRLVKDAHNDYGYHFKEEDFYIYNVIHAYRHYEKAGTGIRSLMDCYVYQQKKGSLCDWLYIEQELEKLGALEFEHRCKTLSSKIFSEPGHCNFQWMEENLSNEELELLEALSGAGTYGLKKNKIINDMRALQKQDGKIRSSTKYRYYFRRMFPGEEYYISYYPFLYRHKYLIPAGLFYRIGKGIVKNRKSLWKEIKLVWHGGDKK